jgi:hypothetical protein
MISSLLSAQTPPLEGPRAKSCLTTRNPKEERHSVARFRQLHLAALSSFLILLKMSSVVAALKSRRRRGPHESQPSSRDASEEGELLPSSLFIELELSFLLLPCSPFRSPSSQIMTTLNCLPLCLLLNLVTTWLLTLLLDPRRLACLPWTYPTTLETTEISVRPSAPQLLEPLPCSPQTSLSFCRIIKYIYRDSARRPHHAQVASNSLLPLKQPP